MKKPDLKAFSPHRQSGAGNAVLEALLKLGEIKSVDLSTVKRDPLQPRPLSEVMEGLQEFADELERDNFILAQYPVYHIEDDGSHTVVVGERRTEGFRLKKQTHITAVCKKFTPEEREQIFIMQYVENDGILKKPLSPEADALWWKNYAEKFHNGVVSNAAAARGRTASDISNRLSILDAPDFVKTFVSKNKVKDPATIASLVRLHKKQGDEYIQEILDQFEKGEIKGSFRQYVQSLHSELNAPKLPKVPATNATEITPTEPKAKPPEKPKEVGDSKTEPKPKSKSSLSEPISILQKAELLDIILKREGQGTHAKYSALLEHVEDAIAQLSIAHSQLLSEKAALGESSE